MYLELSSTLAGETLGFGGPGSRLVSGSDGRYGRPLHLIDIPSKRYLPLKPN